MVPNTVSNSDKETTVLIIFDIIRVRVMIGVRRAEHNSKKENMLRLTTWERRKCVFLSLLVLNMPRIYFELFN